MFLARILYDVSGTLNDHSRILHDVERILHNLEYMILPESYNMIRKYSTLLYTYNNECVFIIIKASNVNFVHRCSLLIWLMIIYSFLIEALTNAFCRGEETITV